MANARKYNLTINSVISCGLGSFTGNTVTCSLLDSFLMICDTVPQTSHFYPQLTENQLETLPTLEYDRRVIDFLDYVNIESGIQKNALFTGATFTDISCNIYNCYLNSNFLVYKFLDGVRVVNVGSANGVVQYKVVGIFGDSYDSGWQNSGTFLGLTSNAVYDISIRDYVADTDIVACEYSKIISMSSLMPSTTVTLPPKVIGFYQLTSGQSGPVCYNTGIVCANPTPLSVGQMVQINYTSNALFSGVNGLSCAIITCTPNGGSCTVYDCLTNTNGSSPKTGSITMCYGDVICYNTTAIASSPGSNATASLCMTSVNGLSTVVPSIDITRCSSCSTMCQAPVNITVGMNRVSSSNPDANTCVIRGSFSFTPAIPIGEEVHVELSAITATLGGSANICFTCKTIGVPIDVCVCGVCNAQSQPQFPVITARNGDTLCYVGTMVAPLAGNTSCDILCLNNLTSSVGVQAIRSLVANCDSASMVKIATPVTVAVCRINNFGTSSNGFINISPLIPTPGQCVTICFDRNQRLCGVGSAVLNILCCPNGGGSYVPYCLFVTSSPAPCGVSSGTLVMRYGDKLCYSNQVSTSVAGSCSCFTLDSITSTSGLNPSICLTKHVDCVTN